MRNQVAPCVLLALSISGCFGSDNESAEAWPSPSPSPSPSASAGDTTAPVPSSTTLTVTVDGTWAHLNVVIPAATDETTSQANLVYEVRMAHSVSAPMNSVSNALLNAGVIQEIQMAGGATSKTAQITLVPAASYAVAVTVRDEAGNRALYTQVVNTSVMDWQSAVSSADSFDITDDTSTSGAEPGPRVGHRAVYFNSNFHVLGGVDNTASFPAIPNNYRGTNEVWTAPTGTYPGSDPEYMKRAFFGATVHTHSAVEKIYVGGGEGFSVARHSDILASSDGAAWSVVTATAPFLPRSDFEFVSHGGNLYAIGGETYASGTYTYQNDIWKSVDGGVNWTAVSAGSRFAGRKRHSAFSMRDCLWVAAGQSVVSGSVVYYRDVWKSCDDGVTWTETSSSAAFAARRAKVAPLAYGLDVPGVIENRTEMMCAMGGVNGASYDTGLHCSYDGAIWFTYNATSGLQRDDHAVTPGGGSFFVFGGTDSAFSGPPAGYPTYGSRLLPF